VLLAWQALRTMQARKRKARSQTSRDRPS